MLTEKFSRLLSTENQKPPPQHMCGSGFMPDHLDIFGNVSDLAGQYGTQLVQSLGLHIIVGPETADSFAVNAAFFSQLIGGDAFFLHQHP